MNWTWEAAVVYEITKKWGVGVTFTRQDFIKFCLPSVVGLTNSIGATTAQTLSRVLQKLRDCGYLRFVDKGKYCLLEPPEIKTRTRSHGERMIEKILKDIGIDFEIEKTLSDLKHINYLRFDTFFITYLPNWQGRNCFVIEFNGNQHNGPIDYFGGQRGFEQTRIRDIIKYKYCYDNNLELIIITELDYAKAKNLIQKRLWGYFCSDNRVYVLDHWYNNFNFNLYN